MTRVDRFRDGTLEERVAVLREIAASAAPAPAEVDLVIASLSDARKAIQRRAAEAAAQCARRDAQVADRLRAMLCDGPLAPRWGAAFALSLLGTLPPAAVSTLLEALDSEDGDVRWAAADLVKRAHEQDAPRLTAALLDAARGGGRNQRKMALYLLRDLKIPAGAEVASDALHAEAIEVRLAALSALVALSPNESNAVDHVLALLADDDQRIRRAAAAALGELGVATAAVLAALDAAAEADDPALQRAARRALEMLGHPSRT